MTTKTKANSSEVRAFGQTRGTEADTSEMGGTQFVSASKIAGQKLKVLSWTFGDSKFGPRCYVNAVTKDALGDEVEITIPLSDKSPAYEQLRYMDEVGDSGEFIGTLTPQGKSFEWA